MTPISTRCKSCKSLNVEITSQHTFPRKGTFNNAYRLTTYKCKQCNNTWSRRS